MVDLGWKFQALLIIPNQPALMACRGAGQWDQMASEALRPEIARCTRKQIKVFLGHIRRITSSTAVACLLDRLHCDGEGAHPFPPTLTPPRSHWWTGKRVPSTGILAWARTTDKHGVSSPMLRQDTDRACNIVGGVLWALSLGTWSM